MQQEIQPLQVAEKLITHCIYCNKRVTGRSDKKFCNDYCRNGYNNKRSLSNTPFMRQVNGILRKNRNIMCSLLRANDAEVAVQRDTLLAAGFHFGYVTHLLTHVTETAYYCYDFCYAIADENCIVIRRMT
jgi:predicted nucleic acid-binding Zn ribbon protein